MLIMGSVSELAAFAKSFPEPAGTNPIGVSVFFELLIPLTQAFRVPSPPITINLAEGF